VGGGVLCVVFVGSVCFLGEVCVGWFGVVGGGVVGWVCGWVGWCVCVCRFVGWCVFVCVCMCVRVGVWVCRWVTAKGDDYMLSHLRIYKVPNKNPHH